MAIRGKPDHGADVHYMPESKLPFGTGDASPMCRTGGYHIRYTGNCKRVTCPRCLKELERKLMSTRTITRNGQSVMCYGDWEEDSNAECIFDDEQFDGVFADSAESWEDAVEQCTAYAKRMDTYVIEMTAC